MIENMKIKQFDQKEWERSSFTQKEKIHTAIFSQPEEASALIAKEIAEWGYKEILEE